MSLKIKLFTMVKNEIDIIKDWLDYHGELFGYSNIYVVDNLSDDGTYEVLKSYEAKHKINLSVHHNYHAKGLLMTNLMENCGKDSLDYGFPIDVDEFLVCYSPSKKRIYTNNIIESIEKLPTTTHGVFKLPYIQSRIDDDSGSLEGIRNVNFGELENVHTYSKTFFHIPTWNFKKEIDHGNHYPFGDWEPTGLHLIHYHCRNYQQLLNKTQNNLKGFGFETTKEYLNNLECNTAKHHQDRMKKILDNEYNIHEFVVKPGRSYVCLQPLLSKLNEMENRDNLPILFQKYHEDKNIQFFLYPDCPISNSLRNHTLWEPHLHNVFEKYIKPNSVVLEAGCHIGTHTIKMALLSKKVYAFEPMPKSNTLLHKNLEINNIENVNLSLLGLSNQMSTTEFDWIPENNPGGSGLANNPAGRPPWLQKTSQNIKVNLVTIDSLGLNTLDFMKIDVEGYEKNVIEGGLETIKKTRPIIVIEIWANHNGGVHYEFAEKEFSKLLSLNYSMHHIEGPDFLFTPNEYM